MIACLSKEKKSIQGYPYQKIRVTIDQNLVFRDQAVSLFHGKKGEPLLEDDFVIMEIKAPGQEPQWLKDILEKYGLVKQKIFKNIAVLIIKSQGLDYAPRPVEENGRCCLCLIYLILFLTMLRQP